MEINITAEDLKDDEVFKRLVIIQAIPNFTNPSRGHDTTHAKATNIVDFANSLMSAIKGKK